MPTGDDYRRAADDFEALAQGLTDEIGPLGRGLTDDVVRGGRLRSALDEAVGAVCSGLAAAVTGYTDVAAECRSRAIDCDRYLVELDAHLRSVAVWEAATDAERQILTVAPAPYRAPWMR